MTLVVAQAAAAVAAPVAGTSAAGRAQGQLTAAAAAQLGQNVSQHVIIFMKAQPAMAPARSAALTARSAVIASDQRPLVTELTQVHATHVTAYRLADAVAATVSGAEEARLKASPAVARVIPDTIIHGPALPSEPAAAARSASSVKALPGACLPHGKVQLEPEALQVTHTQSLSPTAKTARSLGFTGAGVTVAWIADGIDIHNVNFERTPGNPATTVFSDYKDFSGDGTSVTTPGGEAFLDANSIAAQGKHVYNVRNFSAKPLSAACNIRIEGVAPGASLVGLKVFGTNDTTTLSGFLDAINYAVITDHVNVLNESFGANPIPDTAADATRQFDENAVAAGVTVVSSTGDAGPTNTIGSPSDDPEVISAGASTDFRSYGMSQFNGADVFARHGWLNDNISAISSSGFDAAGHTLDLVAPGDSSFTSCSTDVAMFFECTNAKGQASPVQWTGGTSQSSPLTAGAAALVIQAFRQTHSGASPTPAQVKNILLSTASDLGAPAREQGAGLLNTYKAVQAAESIGSPSTATGSTLLTSNNQIDAAGQPGTKVHATVLITNTGQSTQTVHISGRSFGRATDVQRHSITLSNAHSKHFTDQSGIKNNYGVIHFSVRRHQNRLNASIAFPGKVQNGFNGAVRLILVDPRGRFAAHSLPQGLSNFGNVDVLHPAAGRWTAVIFCLQAGSKAFQHGTTGKVLFQASTQKYVSFGNVIPKTRTIAAGGAISFDFNTRTPSQPGDASGSLVLNAGAGATSIPVTLRSRVSVSASRRGSFKGVLTNGNGRASDNGQANYYTFRVPSGTTSLSAEVSLANDASNEFNGFLVDPQGQMQGVGSNFVGTKITSGGNLDIAAERQMTAYANHPIRGVWTLVLEFAQPNVGNELADPFTGHVAFSTGVKVSHAGLPQSASVTLSATKKVAVKITNHGSAPEDFFLDPRITATASRVLVSLTGFGNETVPLTGSEPPAEWLVPTHTTSVDTTSSATVPITFDVSPFLGDPDVFSGDPSTTASATVTAAAGDALTSGGWIAIPAPDATSGFTSPAPTGTVHSMTMTATTRLFDPSVSSSVGDLWGSALSASNSFGLLEIKPGQTKTIEVTINPAKAAGGAGTVVQGTLYLDDLVPVPGQDGGSELLGIPYAYTVGS